MDKQEEKKELLVEQRKIADYAYNNYVIYTKDRKEVEKVFDEFNEGKSTMTTEQYLKKLDQLKQYSEITSIKFTSATTSEMGSLVFYFTINDVIKDSVSLNTVDAETNQWIYSMNRLSGKGEYLLEKKTEESNLVFDKNNITYYKGGID